MGEMEKDNRDNNGFDDDSVRDLDEFGVWVKEGPEDYDESSFPSSFELEDIDDTEDFITPEEEELLGDLESCIPDDNESDVDQMSILEEDSLEVEQVEPDTEIISPEDSLDSGEIPEDTAISDFEIEDMDFSIPDNDETEDLEESVENGSDSLTMDELSGIEDSATFDEVALEDGVSEIDNEDGMEDILEESDDILTDSSLGEYDEISLSDFVNDEETPEEENIAFANSSDEDEDDSGIFEMDLDLDEEGIEEDYSLDSDGSLSQTSIKNEAVEGVEEISLDDFDIDFSESTQDDSQSEDDTILEDISDDFSSDEDDNAAAMDFSDDDIDLSIEDEEPGDMEPLQDSLEQEFDSTDLSDLDISIDDEDTGTVESDLPSFEDMPVELEIGDLPELEEELPELEIDETIELALPETDEESVLPEFDEETEDEIDSIIGEELSFDDDTDSDEEKASLKQELEEANLRMKEKSDVLVKIEEELSSIRDELSSLKQELSSFRNSSIEGKSEAPVMETSEDDDDETIALTGDELDNILSTADITEESVPDNSPDEDLFEQVQEQEESPEEEIEEELSFSDINALTEDFNEEDLSLDEESTDNYSSVLDDILDENSDSAEIIEEEDFSSSELLSSEDFAGNLIDKDDIIELDISDSTVMDQKPESGDDDLATLAEKVSSVEDEDEIVPDIADSGIRQEEDYIDIDIEELQLGNDDDFQEEPETVEEPVDIIRPEPGNRSDSNTPSSSSIESLDSNLKKEITSVLAYMDQLLESLPEEKIREFAESEHFEVYKKLFEELGLKP